MVTTVSFTCLIIIEFLNVFTEVWYQFICRLIRYMRHRLLVLWFRLWFMCVVYSWWGVYLMGWNCLPLLVCPLRCLLWGLLGGLLSCFSWVKDVCTRPNSRKLWSKSMAKTARIFEYFILFYILFLFFRNA